MLVFFLYNPNFNIKCSTYNRYNIYFLKSGLVSFPSLYFLNFISDKKALFHLFTAHLNYEFIHYDIILHSK